MIVETEQTRSLFYCYRCFDCKRLITKLEIMHAWAIKRPNLCSCGGRMIKPTNPHLWEELLLPRVWKLWWAIKTQQIGPPPSSMSPSEQLAYDRKARTTIRAKEREVMAEVKAKKARATA